jgi:hypothetical protein
MTAIVQQSARVRLRTETKVRGFVDGAWWPHSLDLAAELPSLVAAVQAAGIDVNRVTYNLDAWPAAPRRLALSDRTLKLGGFRTQDPATIGLVNSSTRKTLMLVVIPPTATPESAEQALALASETDGVRRAGDVLTLSGVLVS